jgi:hypothetical protein
VLVTSIIRAKGGIAERQVAITDITIADVRSFTLFLPDERWIGAMARYHEDLSMLLAAIKADYALPEEFFVPDLWDTAMKLPSGERELMIDVWTLGKDLADAVGYVRGDMADFIRNGVGGTVYVRS